MSRGTTPFRAKPVSLASGRLVMHDCNALRSMGGLGDPYPRGGGDNLHQF